MPLLTTTTYEPPSALRNGHALTLWAAAWRKLPENLPILQALKRERFLTPDDDFFDVDWFSASTTRPADVLAVVSHGLEGHSRRAYMLTMATALHEAGADVALRNFRFCSGEMNRTPGMYHSGETNDLHQLVSAACQRGYTKIVLVGFSMGGNQTLCYLTDPRLPAAVKAAVVFSVPCDLVGAAKVLSRPSRFMYMEYFMRTLRKKIRQKALVFPDKISTRHLWRMHTFAAFDTAYTAPLHGFSSALDYWLRASSLRRLPRIPLPTLLVNAKDDPFLSESCYPRAVAASHPFLTLEIPNHGGHLGFVPQDFGNSCHHSCYWSDARAVEFFFGEQYPPGGMMPPGPPRIS